MDWDVSTIAEALEVVFDQLNQQHGQMFAQAAGSNPHATLDVGDYVLVDGRPWLCLPIGWACTQHIAANENTPLDGRFFPRLYDHDYVRTTHGGRAV